MIDFNTSKQMQKLNTGLLSDTNSKERNSPLALNRLGQATGGFPGIPGYSPLQLGFNPTAVSAMNTLFNDAQKAAVELNLNKSSPLLIETSKANSPKISSSPRSNIIHSTGNLSNLTNFQASHQQQQQQQQQNKNQQQLSSVIQTSQHQQQLNTNIKTSMSNVQPLYSQAHDAFQTNLQTLVNTAVAQQSLAIPANELAKKLSEEQLKEDDKNNFFNHSALKFSRNPFTKGRFN